VAARAKPTITDVARRAGVSKSLVSLVMRGARHVSPARRAAVLQAAADLRYRPNAMARGLKQQATRVLGVLASHLHSPLFADVVEGIHQQASPAGYRVLIDTGNRVPAREDEALETLLELRVDGLVLINVLAESRLIVEASRQVPAVLVGRAARAATLDSVTNDDRSGTTAAVRHCAALGHRRIAHVDGGLGTGALARRRAYVDAMRALGLGAHVQVAAGTYTEEGGRAGAALLLARDPRPTAILAGNDVAALGALFAIGQNGLRVPEDVSVVGYDDTPLAALKQVALTTVHQPRVEMGRAAVDLLLERIDDDRRRRRRLTLAPHLVVRGTSGPPPATRKAKR
jgi:DNA-binding LacI/PurR family transcriptional regulator